MHTGSIDVKREGARIIAVALCLAGWFLFQPIPAHGKTGDLLQVTSKGHILGFSPGSMYLASGDHLLKVDFAGGKSVAPMAEGPQANDGKAQPLGRITYSNVWDGVSVVYEGSGRSVVKSTYTVADGLRVDRCLE